MYVTVAPVNKTLQELLVTVSAFRKVTYVHFYSQIIPSFTQMFKTYAKLATSTAKFILYRLNIWYICDINPSVINVTMDAPVNLAICKLSPTEF